VKKVNLTLCNSSCTKVFTLWPRMHLQDKAMPEAKLKSSGRKTTKTGGSDPTFSAFRRPKSSWGRSRPGAPCPVLEVFSSLANECQ
jgi:hypothetical protein